MVFPPVLLLFDFLGGGELFIVFVAIMFLFGGKAMPTMMRNLGRGIRELKDATEGIKKDLEEGAGNIRREIEKQTSEIEEKAKDS